MGERMVDQMDAKRAAGDDCLIAKTYPCEEGAGMERAAAACRANDVPLNAGAVPCLPYLSATAARGIVLYLVPIVPFA